MAAVRHRPTQGVKMTRLKRTAGKPAPAAAPRLLLLTTQFQGLCMFVPPLMLPLLPLSLPLPPTPAAASRWARSWPWAGSAPRRPWTGASSGTSSWRGSSRCPWPACSAPPSWRCSSTASCPSSEGTAPGGRAEEEEEGESEKGSVRERESERGKREKLGENRCTSVGAVRWSERVKGEV